MHIQGLYAVVSTAEMGRAEAFYTPLLGREPDDRPMDGLIQWRPTDTAGIQVVLDADKAGHSQITIVTPSMETARADLAGRGLQLGKDIRGDFGIVAQIEDPDRNRLTLAEPPHM